MQTDALPREFTRFEQRCYTLLLKLVDTLLMFCRIATMTSQGLPTFGFRLAFSHENGGENDKICMQRAQASCAESRMYLRTSEDDVAEVTHPWCDASLCFECASTFRSCRWWQFWCFAFVVHLMSVMQRLPADVHRHSCISIGEVGKHAESGNTESSERSACKMMHRQNRQK